MQRVYMPHVKKKAYKRKEIEVAIMAVCCLQVRCWSNDSKESVGLFTYFCSLVQTHSYASVLNHLFIN
jgi:hypothetical protein